MYSIRLQQFEGPLDLLLFFIRRDELDIYDIPIASIADEFLDYVRLLDQVDLDGVGDFLYMAALLINIKTRMLLPTQDFDDEGEPIDPRRELVERLLEYIRFKEASDALSNAHERRQEQFTRGAALENESAFTEAEEPIADASIFDLVQALRRVLTESDAIEITHEVEAEAWSMEVQQEYLVQALAGGERRSFVELVTGHPRGFIITTFLAVLEMARNGLVSLFVERSALDFYLTAPEGQAQSEVAKT
jgi:segregation and condensation protein A